MSNYSFVQSQLSEVEVLRQENGMLKDELERHENAANYFHVLVCKLTQSYEQHRMQAWAEKDWTKVSHYEGIMLGMTNAQNHFVRLLKDE